MIFDKIFLLQEPEATAISRIMEYLELAGYKPHTEVPLQYYRGSLLGTLTRNSPLKWRAIATVSVENGGEIIGVIVRIDVNTTGQMVTNRELKFWKSELDGIKCAATTGLLDVDESIEAARKATTHAVKMTMLWIGAAIPAGILAAIFAVAVTGRPYMIHLGILGVGIGFALVWWRYG